MSSSIYEDDDKFSFCSATFRSHARASSFIGSSAEIDQDFNDNSSLTEVLSSKNELKTKYEAAKLTQQQYKDREQKLKNKIDKMNQNGNKSLSMLEAKKNDLTKTNYELKEQLNSLPPYEFLQERLRELSKILEEQAHIKHPTSFLDAIPLQEIGLLYNGESLAILPQRLQSLISKLNSLTNKTDTNGENTAEERRLMNQIRLLERSSPDSYTRAHYQCQQLEDEVEKLRAEVELLKNRQEKRNLAPPISFEEIAEIVETAGGDPRKIHLIRGSLYKYESELFHIELRFQRIYAVTKEIEIPLGSFIKTFLKNSLMTAKRKYNSLM
ncbi:hypothetical protein TRFO_32795 [Tritrichomonas foetus]|uniref:Uncharacterized protein n=1 Tax=Tritrichomonas foetus TaxID=1144522 RepID=A0A1J4JSI1_9EUKA|nr:hypothetical protein TRFO_32795 [Tritrichomonas foetus]|eukprot:OHT00484.1 hypothetical protein TRFO_32795 [Tritrichomonas foetus]